MHLSPLLASFVLKKARNEHVFAQKFTNIQEYKIYAHCTTICKNFIKILLTSYELHQDAFNRLSFQCNELKRRSEEENRRNAEAKRKDNLLLMIMLVPLTTWVMSNIC